MKKSWFLTFLLLTFVFMPSFAFADQTIFVFEKNGSFEVVDKTKIVDIRIPDDLSVVELEKALAYPNEKVKIKKFCTLRYQHLSCEKSKMLTFNVKEQRVIEHPYPAEDMWFMVIVFALWFVCFLVSQILFVFKVVLRHDLGQGLSTNAVTGSYIGLILAFLVFAVVFTFDPLILVAAISLVLSTLIFLKDEVSRFWWISGFTALAIFYSVMFVFISPVSVAEIVEKLF